ncbi:MAG: hypothetical protein ACR2PZ_13095 [Pseudomonadales bacterium]
MTTTLKTLALAAVLTCVSGVAAAQDYNNWGVIDPYGLQMQDQWGGIHYTDPYAYDSQVDIYGNVITSDYGQLDPSLDYYDLTPVPGAYSNGSSGSSASGGTYVPYTNPTDSHQSFINSIWE